MRAARLAPLALLGGLWGCVIKEGLPALDDQGAPGGLAARPDAAGGDLDGDGRSVEEGDCDDAAFTVHPGRPEVCGDGVDQDCDGADLPCAAVDADGDGYAPAEGDCDDADSAASPARLETCGDGVDQDCNGADLACDALDMDGDGVSAADGDCDEGSARVFPGADDRCGDGVDQDCDGADAPCAPPPPPPPPPSPEDGDGDGASAAAGDCDDAEPAVSPRAAEGCGGAAAGRDDDCDGYPDEGCPGDPRTPTAAFAAGPSLLGSALADPAACARDPSVDENCDEVPQREVRLSAFAIDVHEVTQGQYARCVQAGRCTPPTRVAGVESSARFGDPAYADYPVTWVRQAQAEAYCAWLGGRLPTEAEWERAARGGAPLEERLYLRAGEAPSCPGVNVASCVGDLAPVMSSPADRTAQGVHDLLGNAHELVAGWYDPTYYARAPAQDPPPVGEAAERDQVPVRGGGHRAAAAFSAITYRGFRLLMRQRGALPDVGFRCAFGR